MGILKIIKCVKNVITSVEVVLVAVITVKVVLMNRTEIKVNNVCVRLDFTMIKQLNVNNANILA